MQILRSDEDVFRYLHQHCTPTLINNGCSKSACSDIYTGLLFQFNEDHQLHDPYYSQEEVEILAGRALQLWDRLQAFNCTDADLEVLLLSRSMDLGERVKDILIHYCLSDAENIIANLGGTELQADLALQYAVNRLVERYMKGENLIRENRLRSLKGFILGIVRKKYPTMAAKSQGLESKAIETMLDADESTAPDRFFEPEAQTKQELLIERMGLIFNEAYAKIARNPKDRELLQLWAGGKDWFDIALYFSDDPEALLQKKRRLEMEKDRIQEQISLLEAAPPDLSAAPTDKTELEDLKKTFGLQKQGEAAQKLLNQKEHLAGKNPVQDQLVKELDQIKNELGNLSAAIRQKGNRKKIELAREIFKCMLEDKQLPLSESTKQLIKSHLIEKQKPVTDASKERVQELYKSIKFFFNFDKKASHES